MQEPGQRSQPREENAMATLAIILGRAGSRGVPGKNMCHVAGLPCALWTIRDALSARTVDGVVVSTDDDELASLAREAQIDVVQRPRELASDTATVDAAARHAALSVEASASGEAFDAAVILYANVPVRPPTLIDDAVTLLRAAECDSVQSYQPVGKHHPFWTAVVNDEPGTPMQQRGAVRPWQGDVLNNGVFRRQDLPPAHVPDGGVIAVSMRALMLQIPEAGDGPHAFLGVDRRGVVNGPGSVVDIDTHVDAVVADAILRDRLMRTGRSDRAAAHTEDA
jgi:N-acylneuraminate cytidylyltransferase